MKSEAARLTKLIPCLFILLSCSLGPSGPPKSVNYTVSFTYPDWHVIDPDASDHAYQNMKSHSVMLVNTQCEKYESASLEKLTSGLMIGVSDLKITGKEKRMIGGREALVTDSNGSMDGVRVFMRNLAVRKDRCLYDVVLISQTLDLNRKDSPAFEQLIKGLEL